MPRRLPLARVGAGGRRSSPASPLPLALALTLILTAPLHAQPAAHGVPRPTTEGMEPQVADLLDTTWAGLSSTLDPAAELSAPERAASIGEAGEIFHSHGVVEAAIGCYRRAIELDSESPRWPYLLGYILKNQGRIEDSLAMLRRSEALQSNPFTRFRIAEALAAAGRIDEATEMLQPLTAVDGLRAAVAAELGKVALLKGNAEVAAGHLKTALERQPEAVSLHFPLAQAYRMLGDEDSAALHAKLAGQRAVRAQDPVLQRVGERSVSSETYVAMGARALKAGDLTVAADAYRKAVDLNPANQRAWMNLGAVAMQAGELAEAEAHLRQALELEPDYGFAHFNLAEVLTRRDQSEVAMKHYRLAVESNPGNVEFGIAYGDKLLRAGAHTRAAVQYQLVAEQAPDFARPRYLRGLALAALGDLDAAARSVAAARDLAPDDEDVVRTFVRLASTAPAVNGQLHVEALRAAQQLFAKYRSTDEGELLAMALAANGQFEQAAAIQAQIVEALSAAGVDPVVASYQEENLQLYSRRERAVRPWAGD